jgi:hypothetical protein
MTHAEKLAKLKELEAQRDLARDRIWQARMAIVEFLQARGLLTDKASAEEFWKLIWAYEELKNLFQPIYQEILRINDMIRQQTETATMAAGHATITAGAARVAARKDPKATHVSPK